MDSFQVVFAMLERTDRHPSAEDIQSVAPQLQDIYERLLRVRVVAPTVDVSDGMWSLMEAVGIPNRSLRPKSPKPLSSQLGGSADPGPTSAGQGPDLPDHNRPGLSLGLGCEDGRPVARPDGSFAGKDLA